MVGGWLLVNNKGHSSIAPMEIAALFGVFLFIGGLPFWIALILAFVAHKIGWFDNYSKLEIMIAGGFLLLSIFVVTNYILKVMGR